MDIPPMPVEVQRCVEYAEQRYGVPVELIQAVSHKESNYRSDAIGRNSSSIDVGFMQINDSAWGEFLAQYGIDENDLKDPCVNISTGSFILRRFYLRYGNWTDALSAYNAGHGKIRKTIGMKYAHDVINRWTKIYEAKHTTSY